MWVAPEIKDPILVHAPTRKSVACFGAVSLRSGRFIWSTAPKFDALTFEAFLRKLLRHRPRQLRMILVLDNATYHHAVLLRPLLKAYRGHLRLLYLPPYSPQLSPIERVWKLARRLATHNRYFPTLGALLEAVTERFESWKRPNPVLRRLCGII
jgi:transposase